MRLKGQFSAPGPANRKMLHLQRFRALLDRGYRTRKSVAYYVGELGITPTQLNRVCGVLVS